MPVLPHCCAEMTRKGTEGNRMHQTWLPWWDLSQPSTVQAPTAAPCQEKVHTTHSSLLQEEQCPQPAVRWVLTGEEISEPPTVYLNHEIHTLQGPLLPQYGSSLGFNRAKKIPEGSRGALSISLKFFILMVLMLTSFSVSLRMHGSPFPTSTNLHTYFYTKWNPAEWVKTIGLRK